jgi:hypothetical protein
VNAPAALRAVALREIRTRRWWRSDERTERSARAPSRTVRRTQRPATSVRRVRRRRISFELRFGLSEPLTSTAQRWLQRTRTRKDFRRPSAWRRTRMLSERAARPVPGATPPPTVPPPGWPVAGGTGEAAIGVFAHRGSSLSHVVKVSCRAGVEPSRDPSQISWLWSASR